MSTEEKREQILTWMDAEERQMLAKGRKPSRRWYAARQTAGTIQVRAAF